MPVDEPGLPSRLLRGIPKPECIKVINGKRYLLLETFVCPNAPNQGRAKKKKPPGFEISVNWEDQQLGALRVTHADVRNASQGVAFLPVRSLRAQSVLDLVWLERDKIAGNPFHGNIVIPDDTPQPLRRHIASTLAFAAQQEGEILSREDAEARMAKLEACGASNREVPAWARWLPQRWQRWLWPRSPS